MLSGKEIYVAIASSVITFGSMLGIIKLLLSDNIKNLRESLLALKNNDIRNTERYDKLLERINLQEKCSATMKKDIEHNEQDIYHLGEEFEKYKDKHNV